MPGYLTSRSISSDIEAAVYQSTSKPCSARWMAGSSTCSSGRDPYRLWAMQKPAIVPGTVADFGPIMFSLLATLCSPMSMIAESDTWYISAVAAPGARGLNSITVDFPSFARCISMNPHPPMLVIIGSTMQATAPVATAASTALPPTFSISNPASEDRAWFAATTPFSATTSSLLTLSLLLSDIKSSLLGIVRRRKLRQHFPYRLHRYVVPDHRLPDILQQHPPDRLAPYFLVQKHRLD